MFDVAMVDIPLLEDETGLSEKIVVDIFGGNLMRTWNGILVVHFKFFN